MCNQSFHRQRLQQMMIPCRFLTLMIHHHGSIRKQKHRGFLPSKIHQRPLHSKCRCHPYRFLRHGRRRTCPLVIQLFRPSLGLVKLHSRRQQSMKMFYHRPFRLTRLHLSPDDSTVAKCWRSGTLHLENPVSMRWRSDTFHPETTGSTTTLPQLRRAGFCVLCVNFEDSETHNQIPRSV